MALFTDGPAWGIDDLTDQDSGLLDVSEGNSINLTTKLRLAQEEIATDLGLWLLKSRPGALLFPGNWIRMDQVVVNPALKRWLVMHALALVYRDAYFSQLADRFQSKWQEFLRLAKDNRESFIAGGLPVVNDPLPQAPPPLLTASTAPQTGGTFYANVAWVNAAGQEGAASAASSISVQNGELMVVTPGAAPANATGYRVYAGASLDSTVLQTPITLPISTPHRYLPGQVTAGPLPGTGQLPDFVRPMPRTWLRG